jgi:hypothetical protein
MAASRSITSRSRTLLEADPSRTGIHDHSPRSWRTTFAVFNDAITRPSSASGNRLTRALMPSTSARAAAGQRGPFVAIHSSSPGPSGRASTPGITTME